MPEQHQNHTLHCPFFDIQYQTSSALKPLELPTAMAVPRFTIADIHPQSRQLAGTATGSGVESRYRYSPFTAACQMAQFLVDLPAETYSYVKMQKNQANPCKNEIKRINSQHGAHKLQCRSIREQQRFCGWQRGIKPLSWAG
ncbi:hypothetical protein [Chania multitudinisentens]|uniref:hypothetical protein n=1 Tax=Chania multitudinisentens TaxID=1639108 RepID=UPI0012B59368|nr:hypothetical protein [Chania multitudinisentens]